MNTLTTQRNTIIKLLQEAGERGVSSYKLTYDHHIKQAPTRVYELRKLGFNIISKPFKNSVIYVLSTEPIGTVKEVIKPPQVHDIIREQMDNQVRVWSEKLQRYTWEDKSKMGQQNLI